jgi:hypothetical protein
MSEPSQLYACVRLSRERLDELLNRALPDPSGDAEVLDWLASAEYYGERYTPELLRERILSDSTTVGAWVDWLTAPAPYGFPMPARNSYDDATQMWTLAALDFSENYDDFAKAVAIFREAARYKDLPGDDGLLIYGYMFTNDNRVEVALRLQMGTSQFLGESDAAALVTEANIVMEELMAEGAANAGNTDDA